MLLRCLLTSSVVQNRCRRCSFLGQRNIGDVADPAIVDRVLNLGATATMQTAPLLQLSTPQTTLLTEGTGGSAWRYVSPSTALPGAWSQYFKPIKRPPTQAITYPRPKAPLRFSLVVRVLPKANPSACSPMVSTLRITCVKIIIPMPGSLTAHSLEGLTFRWQCSSPRLSPYLLVNSGPNFVWQLVQFCWPPASSLRHL